MAKRKISYIRWGDLPENMRPAGKTASPDTKVYIDPQTGQIPFSYQLSDYDITNPTLYTPISNAPQSDARHSSTNVVDAQRGAAYSPEFNRNFYGTSDYSALFGDSRVRGVQQAWEHNPYAMQQWTDAGNLVGNMAATLLPVGEALGPVFSIISRGVKSGAPRIISWVGRGLSDTPVGNYITQGTPRAVMQMVTPEGVSVATPIATPVAATSRAMTYSPYVLTGALGLGVAALNNDRTYNTVSILDDKGNLTEYPDSAAVARAYSGAPDSIQTPVDTTQTVIHPEPEDDNSSEEENDEENDEKNKGENNPSNEQPEKQPGRFKRLWRAWRGDKQTPVNNSTEGTPKYNNWWEYRDANPYRAWFWEKPGEFSNSKGPVIRNTLRVVGPYGYLATRPFRGLSGRFDPIMKNIFGGAYNFLMVDPNNPNQNNQTPNSSAIYTKQQLDSAENAARNKAFVVGVQQRKSTPEVPGMRSTSQTSASFNDINSDSIQ